MRASEILDNLATLGLLDSLRSVLILDSDSPEAMELVKWAEQELNGYPPDAALPSYRNVELALHVSARSPAEWIENQPIPKLLLPDEIQELDREVSGSGLRLSVSQLAQVDEEMRIRWPSELVTLLNYVVGHGAVNFLNPSYVVQEAWYPLPPGLARSVEEGVRTELVKRLRPLAASEPDEQNFGAASRAADSQTKQIDDLTRQLDVLNRREERRRVMRRLTAVILVVGAACLLGVRATEPALTRPWLAWVGGVVAFVWVVTVVADWLLRRTPFIDEPVHRWIVERRSKIGVVALAVLTGVVGSAIWSEIAG